MRGLEAFSPMTAGAALKIAPRPSDGIHGSRFSSIHHVMRLTELEQCTST